MIWIWAAVVAWVLITVLAMTCARTASKPWPSNVERFRNPSTNPKTEAKIRFRDGR